MSESSNASSGGIGFMGLLAIVFITLKLTGFINWSWWLVLLPLYGPLLFILALAVVVFCVAFIARRFTRKSKSPTDWFTK